MNNLATLSKITSSVLRKIFANNIIKNRSVVGDFHSVIEFFRSHFPNGHEEMENLEVIIVDGDLYKGEEYVYGAFFSGTEDQFNLQVKKGNETTPFTISTDTPMIVLGYSDDLVMETTIVHEIFHFIVPDRPTGDYATDPDEMGARNMEREFLGKYYNMSTKQSESFMCKKYLGG